MTPDRLAQEREVALALLASTGYEFDETPLASNGAVAAWSFVTAGGSVRADIYVADGRAERDSLLARLGAFGPNEFPMVAYNGALVYSVACNDPEGEVVWTARTVAGALGGEE